MRRPLDIAIAILITLALSFSLRAGFGFHSPPWVPIIGFLVIFAVVRIQTRPRKKVSTITSRDEPWPISGPLARWGPSALICVFSITSVIALLNPLQLVQAVRLGFGNALAKRWASVLNGAIVGTAVYRLPFDGEWTIMRGGTTPRSSHSWNQIAQRYAYDFVVADAERRRHVGRGTRPGDYYCYGRDILAAAEGVVVRTEGRIGNAWLLGYGIADVFARNVLGNHIIIRHAQNEYGLYAHLVRGSVRVKVGDHVQRGQPLACCGHSGHSTEPHLHFHIQDRADFFTAIGVQVLFTDLMIDGEAIGSAHPYGGQRVLQRRS